MGSNKGQPCMSYPKYIAILFAWPQKSKQRCPVLCMIDSSCLQLQGWWLKLPPNCQWKVVLTSRGVDHEERQAFSIKKIINITGTPPESHSINSFVFCQHCTDCVRTSFVPYFFEKYFVYCWIEVFSARFFVFIVREGRFSIAYIVVCRLAVCRKKLKRCLNRHQKGATRNELRATDDSLQMETKDFRIHPNRLLEMFLQHRHMYTGITAAVSSCVQGVQVRSIVFYSNSCSVFQFLFFFWHKRLFLVNIDKTWLFWVRTAHSHFDLCLGLVILYEQNFNSLGSSC